MKKIFILTGEASGDKLASTVIEKIQENNNDIKFLSVGGSNLTSLGINSIFNIEQITYMGFTSVLLNIFKIKKKIDFTVKEIIKFDPDILFSVDSPDFTLRVAERVKKINPNIKTIHYVAPQVWIWREGRVKKFKNFIDHFLLLFDFERKYFDRENIPNTFVGHPLLDKKNYENVLIDQFLDKKNIISIFPGSRDSEINYHIPILISFIKKMNIKDPNYNFIFHATDKNKELITSYILKESIKNIDTNNIEQKHGVNIIIKALEAPMRQIVSNAGQEPSVVLEKVRNESGNFGYNAANNEYGDMVKFGILDPTKVTRTTLQHAASIAGLMITTECTITEIPKSEKDNVSNSPDMGSNMGGMNGMGGMGGGMM